MTKPLQLLAAGVFRDVYMTKMWLVAIKRSQRKGL